ncbi:MAG: sterol desaturase family protein [Parvibaculum sp.]|nr:sterol desaturase family protein [Parvibaculum sp.]|tara:strand:+ start:3050 stop:3952 length:903 start_codon:yes stop_codon:yes gene_type:complete
MSDHEPLQRVVPFFFSRLFYPLVFFSSVGVGLVAIAHGWNYGIVSGALIGGTAISLIALETIYPAKRAWRMTFISFFKRDLKYMVAGISASAAISYLGALAALEVASFRAGFASELPLYLSLPLAILIFDFIQYWTHRWMHETTWPLGGLLWRIHAGHHLPDAVYVLMHPVAHPLNDIIVRQGLNIGLIWLIGFNTDTVLIFTIITVVGGLFSHFNLDVRAGVLNYFFVSTELHRFHHSADLDESKNFGIITPFWDIVFGTFVYRPGRLPQRIGVVDPAQYPPSNHYWAVFMLPFRRAAR